MPIDAKHFLHNCTAYRPATASTAWAAVSTCHQATMNMGIDIGHDMEAPSEASIGDGWDWVCLPAGALLHIVHLASTWQTPGPCLAAPVCRAWRAAAAECGGIRLLYNACNPATAGSFATWLWRNSPLLEELTIISNRKVDMNSILGPLAKAATAAAAAGRPLPLHTLRVLGDGPALHLAGRLVSELPHLRTLHLKFQVLRPKEDAALVSQHLAPLQRATQLEELYLWGPLGPLVNGVAATAPLLPVGLKRLTWPTVIASEDLSSLQHLTQLTFLQLACEREGLSSKLPPGLQQLQLDSASHPLGELAAQPRLVTGLRCPGGPDSIEQLSSFTNLHILDLPLDDQLSPAACTALAQLPHLSTLRARVPGRWEPAEAEAVGHAAAAVSAIAAASSSLRHLHLFPGCALMAAAATGLSLWKGLTRLTVAPHWARAMGNSSPPYTWVEALGQLPRLRRLSVPAGALQGGWAWLGELQQLRVLVVQCVSGDGNGAGAGWLEGCSAGTLPQQLQLLAVSGASARLPATWELRRRLQQLVGSSGCEVLVGVDLNEVADAVLVGGPTQ